MDPIEQAIRNAFSKGNPEDPAFRERVYRSASAALEKALLANASIAPEAAERRRKGLLTVITSIESEFVPAVDPVTPPAASAAPPVVAPPVAAPVAAAPAGPVAAAPEIRVAAPSPAHREEPPMVAARERPQPVAERREPDWSAPEVERPMLAAEPRAGEAPRSAQRAAERDTERPKRGRNRWGLVAGLLSFLIIVGLAVWTAAEFGLVDMSGGNRLQETAGSQPSGTDGAPRKPGEEEALENWVVVFSPDDPTSVAASVGARAEVIDAGGENALRITTADGSASVRFDVGQGILEQIAGKRAVFDIIARTGDGPETQMSVACNFGALGDCGRNRYIVGAQRSEFLFEVEVPAGSPGGGGTIEIQSDVENGGKAVEIIQIRVSATAL